MLSSITAKRQENNKTKSKSVFNLYFGLDDSPQHGPAHIPDASSHEIINPAL